MLKSIIIIHYFIITNKFNDYFASIDSLSICYGSSRKNNQDLKNKTFETDFKLEEISE